MEPIFNQFTPLQNKSLETKIVTLADRAGIHGSRVYEVNKSIDTKTANAYVTGFMGTNESFCGTPSSSKLDDRELLFVMGHELGHYVLGHVIKGILFFVDPHSGGVLRDTSHRVCSDRPFKRRFGFDHLSDMASLPLMYSSSMFFRCC